MSLVQECALRPAMTHELGHSETQTKESFMNTGKWNVVLTGMLLAGSLSACATGSEHKGYLVSVSHIGALPDAGNNSTDSPTKGNMGMGGNMGMANISCGIGSPGGKRMSCTTGKEILCKMDCRSVLLTSSSP